MQRCSAPGRPPQAAHGGACGGGGGGGAIAQIGSKPDAAQDLGAAGVGPVCVGPSPRRHPASALNPQLGVDLGNTCGPWAVSIGGGRGGAGEGAEGGSLGNPSRDRRSVPGFGRQPMPRARLLTRKPIRKVPGPAKSTNKRADVEPGAPISEQTYSLASGPRAPPRQNLNRPSETAHGSCPISGHDKIRKPRKLRPRSHLHPQDGRVAECRTLPMGGRIGAG